VRPLRALAAAVVVAALAVLGPAGPALAQDGGADDTVEITMFVGEGCPYCEQARAFFSGLTAAHPNLEVVEHEVWYDPAGAELMARTASDLGATPGGVPFIVLDDQWWSGYAPSIGDEIAAAVLPRLGATTEAAGLVESGDSASYAGVLAAAALGVAVVGGVLLVRSRARAATVPTRATPPGERHPPED
jgi:glutaredoxin